jgi:histidinol-phosphate aminotransferase
VSETSPKLRAELEGIPTYKPGKPAASADGPVAYKLSSNENPYPPLPGVLESVQSRRPGPSTATPTWRARG